MLRSGVLNGCKEAMLPVEAPFQSYSNSVSIWGNHSVNYNELILRHSDKRLMFDDTILHPNYLCLIKEKNRKTKIFGIDHSTKASFQKSRS